MHAHSFARALVASVALSWASAAHAVLCYVVLDRNDNVIYRSSVPPVDLSANGDAQREQMRARGQHMIFGSMDICPGVSFFTGGGGTSGVALEGAPDSGRAAGGSPPPSARPPPGPAAAPAPAGGASSAGSYPR